MSTPPPKPTKPSKPPKPQKPGVPSGRQLPSLQIPEKPGKPEKPVVPGGRQLPSPQTRSRPIIPAGRSFRARPQSVRPSASATKTFTQQNENVSLVTSALLEQPLPSLPKPPSRPPLKMPPRPAKKTNSVDMTCPTPPLTPTSSRTQTPECKGKILPSPMASLPEPTNQPLPQPPPRQNTKGEATPTPPKRTISGGAPPIPQKPSLPPKPQEEPASRPKPSVPIPQSRTFQSPEGTKITKELSSSSGSTSGSSAQNKRVSVRNPGLENVLSMRFASGGQLPIPGQQGGAAVGPPESPPPPSPSPSDKRKSKIPRPKKSSKSHKGKSSQVFGTLPRLMGGVSKDKDKKDQSDTPPLECSSPVFSKPSAPLRNSESDVTPATEQNATQDNSFKWKRGAEAEAILKLINETKDLGTASTSDATKTRAPSVNAEALDAEAIMKILGLEEPGIQLPKHKDGEEKALDPTSELQLTERNFIADLGLLNETFVKPVRSQNILPAHTIEGISINLDRLISLHRELYKNFLNDSSLLGIATTFSDSLITEMERLYTVYMGHYESSLALFHEKRDNVTQFRKYLKQREDMTDKSVPNLLVTPVQRVCKYELMLASIKRTVMKHADPNDLELQRHAELLQTKIDALNITLVNVDRRRAAADNWDKINQLEKSLLLSESLSKVGRIILLTTETTVRVGDEEKMFKLVLFNDQLIRTKVAKKSSKARLLDSIPLNQLQVIDITTQDSVNHKTDAAERFSFFIIPTDPRLPIWTVHFTSESSKKEWLDNLMPRVLPFERFCDSWGISKKTESLIAADGGRWPQEYVNECRLFVTTNHLCVLWKMFGIEERELVPLHLLSGSSITTLGKEKAIKLSTTNWKQDYTFTNLQLLEHTEPILNAAIQRVVASPPRMPVDRRKTIVQANNPFILSPMEWASIWSEAKKVEFKPNDVIIDTKQSHAFLYQLLKGRVMVNGNPPVLVAKEGTIFGASSFFEEIPPPFTTIAGDAPVTVLQLNRDTLVASCDANHLMKFFATLAKRLAPS